MPAFSLSASQFSQRAVPVYKDFASYLHHSFADPFVLNLREANLMEVITACVQAKSRLHPNYASTLACLIHNLAILEKENDVVLKPVQVTDVFWGFFIQFLQDRGLRNSTIETVTNQLRSVLTWSTKYNATVSPTYNDVLPPRPDNHEIALTADDVSRITYFDIDRFYAKRRKDFRESMHKVRDQFVLACNLGQRFSDMIRITPSCFEKNIFRISQQKTGNLAVVDINKYAISPKVTFRILDKYGYSSPYTGTIGNYNYRLHTLMRDIGFDDPIRVEEKKHGKMVVENIPKWKMISSHTSRRTFSTINVLRGKNIHGLKKATGHGDIRSLEIYIRDDQ